MFLQHRMGNGDRLPFSMVKSTSSTSPARPQMLHTHCSVLLRPRAQLSSAHCLPWLTFVACNAQAELTCWCLCHLEMRLRDVLSKVASEPAFQVLVTAMDSSLKMLPTSSIFDAYGHTPHAAWKETRVHTASGDNPAPWRRLPW